MNNNTCSRLILSAAALAVMAGCGGGSTFNVQNPPPPTSLSSPLTVAFQPAPPSSILINGTAQLTAVVQNDDSKAGVDWSIGCPQPGKCGSLSPLHTASGEAVTYSSPPTIFGNNETVSIVALATADHTKNVQNPIAVTAYGSILGGTYVMQTDGSDFSGLPYQRAGVITLDGNGGIVAGEQTVNFSNPNTGLLSSVTDAITGGSYFVGADGRGELVINTNDPDVGQNGIQTFSLVVLSNSQVLLNKVDDPTFAGASNEVSVGYLDLQTTPPAPSLGNAFVASGLDVSGSPLGMGGVLNIDSPPSISGTGSAFDVTSPSNYGPGVVVPSSTVSGTVSTPDAFGTFQITLATDFANSVQFTVYPIDATRAKLIETDGSFGFASGALYTQGSQTGTYKGKGKFNNTYAFAMNGRDLGGGAESLAAAGVFSTTGAGTLSNGFMDESQAGDFVQVDDNFQATYAVGPGSDPTITTDPAGTGRYYIPLSANTGFPKFTFTTPTNGSGPALVFYMSTTNGPVLILDADVEPNLFGGGAGTGIAFPLVAGSSFSGPYGTVFTQNLQATMAEVVGEITANNNTLSGVLDFNAQPDDTSLTGTLQAGPVAHRLRGTITDDLFSTSLGTTTLKVAFYPIDSTQGFFVEHDLPATGDVTFGSYYARTPVCQGCP